MVCSLVLPGMLDHCRIGSLENKGLQYAPVEFDHCRIGSLENGPSEQGCASV